MTKIIVSLFYFTFGFLLLFFAIGTRVVLGPALALPASLFFIVGIVMIVRLYQLWRVQDAFSKSFVQIKNIIPFLLLLVLGTLFLNGLSSMLPYFIGNSTIMTEEWIGGLAALVLSSIIMCFLFRRMFKV